jgi:S-layer homology domain
MKTIEKKYLQRKPWGKFISFLVAFSLIISLFQPIVWTNAAVADGGGNTILWTNNNYINSANSGSYAVNYNFSGSLDAGNTFEITATDGSGMTTSGSYTSPVGGESSGSILLNFSNSLLREGIISYNALVYSGNTSSPVVASGMTLTGILDRTAPITTLIGSGNISVIQNSTYTDSGASWTDAQDGSGMIMAANSGSVNTSMTWSYILEYFKVDNAGNTGSNVMRTVNVVASTADTTAPVVMITSHTNDDTVTGNPTISWTVSDSGWISNVRVNGVVATTSSGVWSRMNTTLSGWSNTITVVATDLAGNTGSTSIVLNRVSATSNVNSSLSWTSSVKITFSTDLSSTWVVSYGTSSGSLNMMATGSSMGTAHSFTLTGLLLDTIYYYQVQWQWWVASSVREFKTPTTVENTASGNLVATGSVYLSGSTSTGVTMLWSGSLEIMSISSSWSSITFPLSGLVIRAIGNNWDGVIQAPEKTGTEINLPLAGYGFSGTAYQIGNSNSELTFSGQLATISINIGTSLSWQTVRVFRSTNLWTSYSEITTCVVSGSWDCIFTTSQLSLFALAVPADTVPNAFSFVWVAEAEVNTSYTSSSATISGITAPTAISITGGEYSINGWVFTNLSGSVNSGDTVNVRALSSSSYSTATTATLTIGGVSANFIITTRLVTGPGGGGWGGGWGGGGGGGITVDVCPNGDTSGNLYDRLCVPSLIDPGTVPTPNNTGSFNIPPITKSLSEIRLEDVWSNWAKDYIVNLARRGVINNGEYYYPDANLTRAEFLKIVLNTTGWSRTNVNINTPFNDVPSNMWYAEYVALALEKWMIRNATMFRPNDTITRAEATKILTIALWVKSTVWGTRTFSDVDYTSDLAGYIESATFLNIVSGQMKGSMRIFRPDDSITRAEIAKVVVNAFDL